MAPSALGPRHVDLPGEVEAGLVARPRAAAAAVAEVQGDKGARRRRWLLAVVPAVVAVAVLVVTIVLLTRRDGGGERSEGVQGGGHGDGASSAAGAGAQPASGDSPGVVSGGTAEDTADGAGVVTGNMTTTTTTTPSSPPSTTATLPPTLATMMPTTTTSTVEAVQKCYMFSGDLSENPLQVYPGSPDSRTTGYALCTLCTNGTLSCTTLLQWGKSELIATHIHMATGEDGRDGSNGEGPPIINFCGSNAPGGLLDGTDYPLPCAPWDSEGHSSNKNMPGVLVAAFNRGITVAARVEMIAKTPEMYYFNFHSRASWAFWYPGHQGICRGTLQLQGEV